MFSSWDLWYDVAMNSREAPPIPVYFVYILACADGTLYTGVTNDLEGRIAAHNSGKGAKYTAGRAPVELVYQEEADGRSAALRRELAIKKLTKEGKLRLIAQARRERKEVGGL